MLRTEKAVSKKVERVVVCRWLQACLKKFQHHIIMIITSFTFFFAHTKMSWRSLLTSKYSKYPVRIKVQSCSVLRLSHNGCGSGSDT